VSGHHHPSSLFSQKDGRQGRQEKKEGESTFAALTSILPVETQCGAWGILQKSGECGSTQQNWQS